MISVDTHGIEPVDFLSSRIEKQYLDRIPRIKVDEDGAQWMISEAMQPSLIMPGRDVVKHLIEREVYEEPVFQPILDEWSRRSVALPSWRGLATARA
jgi:hypothetical protein